MAKPGAKLPFKARPNTLPSQFGGVTLLSGSRISMGGEDDDNTEAVVGDFNGDGMKDVAKLIYNPFNGYWYPQLSILLGNGDGTFKAPMLASLAQSPDAIIVGDLDGDGKDDLILAYGSPASFDVLISNGDGTFKAPVNYVISTTNNVMGGLLADVDGDGKLDVLVIDSASPANVIELLGVGDGTFKAASTLTTLSAAAPYDIFFADFNGDGVLDFAGNDPSTNQISVSLGVGTGTPALLSSFAAPVLLTTSDAVYRGCHSTAGDLTGDSKPEIVSVNCGWTGSAYLNNLTVYVNNGDGTFKTGAYYNNTGDQYMFPSRAAIADLNGDGKNDVVVGNVDSGTLSVFMGAGDGTLTVQAVTYNTGGYPWTTPIVADFNGDTLPDILIPDDNVSLVYLQGYGDGTFHASLNYYLTGSFAEQAYTYSVAAGDFNGDGVPDVVVGQDGGTTNAVGVQVYLSNGDGTLAPGIVYGTSPTLAYVAVADFDGKNGPDIAATDYYNGVVQIFLNNGDGTFTVGNAYSTDTLTGPRPENLVTGDFNGDGFIDLAIVNEGTSTVGILLGNGDGTFKAVTTTSLTSLYPYSIAAADLNGDGKLDLAVTSNYGKDVAILLGNGDGTFQAENDFGLNGWPEFVTFGDINNDGKLDMAVTEYSGLYPGAVEVALGNGDGTFQTASSYPTTTVYGGSWWSDPGNIQMLDFNNDGSLDLVYVNDNFGTVAVMYGNGDGTFNPPIEFATSGYPWGMAIADVNGDGAPDVLTGNDESGGVSVLLNTSGVGAQPDFKVSTTSNSATVTAGSAATYPLDLVGKNGYGGDITFACSGLPNLSNCSFNPASITALGNLPFSTTVTITTTAPGVAALLVPARPAANPRAPFLLATLSSIGLFGLLFVGGGKKRVSLRTGLLLVALFVAMVLTLVSCSSSSPKPPPAQGTQPGTYTVTVTATGTGATAPTHTVDYTLIVQ